MSNKRYVITDVRELKENEFIFDYQERIVASTEFNRLKTYFSELGFKFKLIDDHSLPKDFNGGRLVGYRIEYERPLM